MTVKLRIKLENVLAVNIKSVVFGLGNLLEERDIQRFTIGSFFSLIFVHNLIIWYWNLIGNQEFFQLGLQVHGVNICTPENLSVR